MGKRTTRPPRHTHRARIPAGASRQAELIDYHILEPVAEALKAVAHPVRLRIIELLADGERYVGELIAALGTKPAITSQQLGLMKDKGILASRRDGSRVYYRVANPNVIRVIECIRRHCADRKANEGTQP